MPLKTTPTRGQTVQFGLETLDIGSGYNPSTSIYTVPLTGVYTFTWTIRKVEAGYYATDLVVNNDVKESLLTGYDGGVSTATTVVAVNAGDRVFIRVHNLGGQPAIAMVGQTNGTSTFSGWVIQ